MEKTETSLYIVPTPIGNLQDFTFRAVEILKSVDIILAEDTRTTGILLNHYGIVTRMKSHHIHNEHRQVEEVVKNMLKGERFALVSDAGTPGISDPGFLLVREALKADLKVECLPGATAFVPALIKSGLPADRFVFEGFLPHKKGRQTRIQQLASEERTLILYESPHRLVKTLGQLAEYFGEERKASVSRELSKLFEETQNASLKELKEYFEEKGVKGEIVLVIEGRK